MFFRQCLSPRTLTNLAAFVCFWASAPECFTCNDEMNLFGDAGCVVTNSFKILGHENQMRADNGRQLVGLHQIDDLLNETGVQLVDVDI